MALLLVLLAETVGLWFVNAKLVIPAERMAAANWIYQAAIISSVFAIITSPFGSLITAHERMDLSAFISVLNALLRLGIVLLIKYVYCDKLVLYAILLLLISVLDWVLYVLLTKRRFPESTIRITWDKKMFTSMVSFSGWVLVDSLSQMLKGHGLNIVLNLFFGPVVNSARGIAYQIMAAVSPPLTLHLSCATNVFLVGLLPSRAQLCFSWQCKSTNFFTTRKISSKKTA